jgi:hypothetical protein
MSIFFLTFEAMPCHNHPQRDEVGGAFVNCWINAETLAEAEQLAREIVEQSRWHIDNLTESYADDGTLYDHDAPGLQYYEQALVDDSVLVYHTYPAEEERDAGEIAL